MVILKYSLEIKYNKLSDIIIIGHLLSFTQFSIVLKLFNLYAENVFIHLFKVYKMAEPVLEEVTAGSSKVRDTSTLKPIDSSTVASAVEFEIINLLSVKSYWNYDERFPMMLSTPKN